MSTVVKLFPARPAGAQAIGQGVLVAPQLVLVRIDGRLRARQRVRASFADDHQTRKGTVHISKRHQLIGVWLDDEAPIRPAHVPGIDENPFPIDVSTAGSPTRQLVADQVDAFLADPTGHAIRSGFAAGSGPAAGSGAAAAAHRIRSPFCWILPGLPFCHH